MGMLTAYALSANKLDVFECIFRRIDIVKKSRLFYEVFFKRLLWRTIGDYLEPQDYLEIPMAFPVCRVPLYHLEYYWLLGKYNPYWKQYICAGINFPFLCILPSVLGHRLAIDGGAADNIPIFPLLKKGKEYLGEGEDFDLILVLHFDARYDWRKEFTTDIPIIDLDLGISNGFKKNHYDFSTKYVSEMIEKSEEYGQKICERLFGGDCTREHFRKVADEIFLEEHEARQKNISVDRLFSMLNIIGKALRNDADCNRDLY